MEKINLTQFPSTIIIAGIRHEIIVTTDALLQDGNEGYYSFNDSKIVLKEDLEVQTAWKILIHEVFHAIDEHYDMKLSHRIINQLETAWYQVLKDNKEMWYKIK